MLETILIVVASLVVGILLFLLGWYARRRASESKLMSTEKLAEKIISEGWILDEDFALKEKLKGVVVSDQHQRARALGVWFAHPDLEIREQEYPYATIELMEVSEAQERVHRGNDSQSALV